ncbi:LCP family protein required for cell wall assembly [Lipingzhangella halophila]|uniref:LCP family protein required for cell wall assembly n=1 Tax=Lipingzhangella halophila TaxID=1783352 RepID=A0A7W7W242_9ACTN|nr:LCP family protein [Lipingzhangella halophila]MBB4931617.1 LCP family protein required for cell wall assembly [Lipingzhangella halophila]
MVQRRRSRARVVLRVLLALAVVLAAVVGAASWRLNLYDREIARIDDAMPEEQGRPRAAPGQNWLLVGSDWRGERAEEEQSPEEARADAIMLLHMPEDEQRGYVVSIPRDSYVPIEGHDDGKISTALEKGGPGLLTQTVEELSGVRVDHVAILDFHGFERSIDALGGVEVDVKRDVSDPSNEWSWSAGRQHMDGEEALRFVRERKGLPEGTTDRMRRQQAVLNAVGEKARSQELLRDPGQLDHLLRIASESLAVDDEVTLATLRGLAERLAAAGPERISYTSLPVARTDWVGSRNVARLDEERTGKLFTALDNGTLDQYFAEHDLGNNVDEVN